MENAASMCRKSSPRVSHRTRGKNFQNSRVAGPIQCFICCSIFTFPACFACRGAARSSILCSRRFIFAACCSAACCCCRSFRRLRAIRRSTRISPRFASAGCRSSLLHYGILLFLGQRFLIPHGSRQGILVSRGNFVGRDVVGSSFARW